MPNIIQTAYLLGDIPTETEPKSLPIPQIVESEPIEPVVSVHFKMQETINLRLQTSRLSRLPAEARLNIFSHVLRFEKSLLVDDYSPCVQKAKHADHVECQSLFHLGDDKIYHEAMESFFQVNTLAIECSFQAFQLAAWLSGISLDDPPVPYNADLCNKLVFTGPKQPIVLPWIRSLSINDLAMDSPGPDGIIRCPCLFLLQACRNLNTITIVLSNPKGDESSGVTDRSLYLDHTRPFPHLDHPFCNKSFHPEDMLFYHERKRPFPHFDHKRQIEEDVALYNFEMIMKDCVQGGKVRTLILDWTPHFSLLRRRTDLRPRRKIHLTETRVSMFQMEVWEGIRNWFSEQSAEKLGLEAFVRVPGFLRDVDVQIFPGRTSPTDVWDSLEVPLWWALW